MAAQAKLKEKLKAVRKAAEAAGPLSGKKVRVVDPSMPKICQNSVVTCSKHWQKDRTVCVSKPGTHTASSSQFLKLADYLAEPISGSEKPQMPERLDRRQITAEQKITAMAACGGALKASLMPDRQLQGPELTAGWQEILARGRQAADCPEPGEIELLSPETVKACLLEQQAGKDHGSAWDDLTGKSGKTGLWQQLSRARVCSQSCTILLPVHSGSPEHWTLLVLTRPATEEASQQPENFKVQFFDSLSKSPQTALDAAAACLRLLASLLQPAEIAMPECLQASARSRIQTDGWSCGFWVLSQAEVQYRLHRGEGYRLPSTDLRSMRERLNLWLDCLDKFCQKRKCPEAGSDSQKVQKTGSAAAAALAAGAAAAAHKPPPAPLPSNAVQQDQKQAGCSKCRWSDNGCAVCCPIKQKAWLRKKGLLPEQ